MIHILPIEEVKEHDESSTCSCGVTIMLSNGDMIAIHQRFNKNNPFSKDEIKEIFEEHLEDEGNSKEDSIEG